MFIVIIFMHCSIIQRVGVVPMSIAGIAKEVATISVSAVLFGDELTPLNISGVAVTVCGKSIHHGVGKKFAQLPFLTDAPTSLQELAYSRIIIIVKDLNLMFPSIPTDNRSIQRVMWDLGQGA